MNWNARETILSGHLVKSTSKNVRHTQRFISIMSVDAAPSHTNHFVCVFLSRSLKNFFAFSRLSCFEVF